MDTPIRHPRSALALLAFAQLITSRDVGGAMLGASLTAGLRTAAFAAAAGTGITALFALGFSPANRRTTTDTDAAVARAAA